MHTLHNSLFSLVTWKLPATSQTMAQFETFRRIFKNYQAHYTKWVYCRESGITDLQRCTHHRAPQMVHNYTFGDRIAANHSWTLLSYEYRPYTGESKNKTLFPYIILWNKLFKNKNCQGFESNGASKFWRFIKFFLKISNSFK